MYSSRRERKESRAYAVKVTWDEAFAEGTKWSQRAYFYINSTESIRAGGPLCANLSYRYNGSGRISVFAFRATAKGGYLARVVQVDKAGNLSFARDRVKSTDPTGVEKAVDKGRRLADTSQVLANTAFLEAYPRELIVFGSKNATALTGGKEIEQGYYLVTRAPAETLAEQLKEKRKEIVELERKLDEAIKEKKKVQMENANRGRKQFRKQN
jgi:hypothetical protein